MSLIDSKEFTHLQESLQHKAQAIYTAKVLYFPNKEGAKAFEKFEEITNSLKKGMKAAEKLTDPMERATAAALAMETATDGLLALAVKMEKQIQKSDQWKSPKQKSEALQMMQEILMGNDEMRGLYSIQRSLREGVLVSNQNIDQLVKKALCAQNLKDIREMVKNGEFDVFVKDIHANKGKERHFTGVEVVSFAVKHAPAEKAEKVQVLRA